MLNAESEYYENESMFHGFIPRVMGTRFDALLISDDKPAAQLLWESIVNELATLDGLLNRFDPCSMVSKLNAAGGKVDIKSPLAPLLALGKRYRQQTLSLFDMARGQFSKLVFLSDGSVEIPQGVTLDFGGFAKGYAMAQIKSSIERSGILNAFVDFGGSAILGMGSHPHGDCWKVGLQSPYSQNILREFNLRNSALSTSGNSPQYTGHIIDPLTGERNTERKLTAIVSPNPLDAEVLSTTWMVADEIRKERIRPYFHILEEEIYYL